VRRYSSASLRAFYSTYPRYYPPDYDPSQGSLNKARGTQPAPKLSNSASYSPFSPLFRKTCVGRSRPEIGPRHPNHSLRIAFQYLVVSTRQKIYECPLPIFPVEHATTTLAWVFVIMQRRRKSVHITRHPSFRSVASAISATGGSKSKPTPRYVILVSGGRPL